MASTFSFRCIRSLLPLRSFIHTTPFSSSGASRSYTVLEHSQQHNHLSLLDEEIAALRREFDAAKQSFLKVPHALNQMPKMDPRGIYANKNLRLDKMQVYGFDYDYTLAHYTEQLQSLIYDQAKEFMVNELKYPEACMKFQYDPTFPIRGLHYDKTKGCLLKLDFFWSIEPEGCYFGRRKLSSTEIRELYGTRHIGRDHAQTLAPLMDFFCFSEACLLADMVQYFVDAKLEFDASYIYEDVLRAIQHVHLSGLVHRGILADPHRYLLKNGKILEFLMTLKERGKKLFLLTNSPYYFVDEGMRFMLEEDSMGYRDSWRELFDVVIVKARKPQFYSSEHPFRCYDTEKDTLTFTKVDAFLPNKIYHHGCLKSFLQITKWKGPEMIYFGDHLFSDLKGPSKAGWRTAAIIRELERRYAEYDNGLLIPKTAFSVIDMNAELLTLGKEELMVLCEYDDGGEWNEIQIQNEDSYRVEQAKFHIITELLGKLHGTAANSLRTAACNSLLDELNEERQKARNQMKIMFNRSFGSTFLTTTGQESSYAYNIHQYADVYTSKPENFLLHSPEAWLHVPFDVKIMPHHVKVPSSLFRTR